MFAPVGGLFRTGRQISFQSVGDPATPVWLVAGPFQDSGDNALFSDLLWWVGGERGTRAREGGVAGRSWPTLVRWRRVDADKDGLIDFKKIWPLRYHSIAYAYTELNSDTERDVVATVGSGTYLQVWLNGNIIFENRLLRHYDADRDTLVLHLHKGTNTVLVKALEMVEQLWQLQWQTRFPTEKLFVNPTQTVIPDFVEGETQSGWGQVEVANTGLESLNGVVVQVEGDVLVQASRSEPHTIGAGEVERIPVRIAGVGPAPSNAPGPIHIKVSSGSEACETEFAPRMRTRDQYFVNTFRSGVDGSVQTYSVWLPSSFKPSTTYPLVVLLHGGTVTDWGQNIFAYSQKSWAILAAPYGRGDNYFRDIGEVDLDEMTSEVGRRYHIDQERMYLSGHSDGGSATWFQAVRRPYLWASVSAQSAATDAYFQRPDLQDAGNTSQRRFEKQLLDSWSPITFAENMMYVPAYVIHGDRDLSVPVQQSRQMRDRLSELGYKCTLDEYSDRGHWWWGQKSKTYNAECADQPAIYEFFQRYSPRASHPARIVYETDSLRYNKAYWITIDEMDDVNSRARVEAQVNDTSEIDVKLVNIDAITVNIDPVLIHKDTPLTIKVNGTAAYAGSVPESGSLRLIRGNDGLYSSAMSGVGTAANSPKKTHELFGPIDDAFESPFLFVLGTQGEGPRLAAVRRASDEAARVLARDWMLRANGIVRIKNDVDVTDSDIAGYNLILFGNAETNSLISKMNSSLPIRFSGPAVAVGPREFRAGEIGMVEVVPNPMNRSRYAVIVGGVNPRSFRIASRLQFADLPDYVVFDRDTLSGKKTVYVVSGFFNKNWALDAEL